MERKYPGSDVGPRSSDLRQAVTSRGLRLRSEVLRAEVLRAEVLRAEVLRAEVLRAEVLRAEVWGPRAEVRCRDYFPTLAAIFLTMASTSLRSLSFRLTAYRRIWLRKRTSSSESWGSPLEPLLCPDRQRTGRAGAPWRRQSWPACQARGRYGRSMGQKHRSKPVRF